MRNSRKNQFLPRGGLVCPSRACFAEPQINVELMSGMLRMRNIAFRFCVCAPVSNYAEAINIFWVKCIGGARCESILQISNLKWFFIRKVCNKIFNHLLRKGDHQNLITGRNFFLFAVIAIPYRIYSCRAKNQWAWGMTSAVG